MAEFYPTSLDDVVGYVLVWPFHPSEVTEVYFEANEYLQATQAANAAWKRGESARIDSLYGPERLTLDEIRAKGYRI